MYSYIISNTASYLVAASNVYSHLPSVRHRRSLPSNHCAIWSQKPTRTPTMQGVTTHVSAPKSSTDWITALKKNPYTCGTSTYLLIILVNLRHTVCAFSRFLTTAEQSLSASEITWPKYLKAFSTKRRGKNGHLFGFVPHTNFCLFDTVTKICTSSKNNLLL